MSVILPRSNPKIARYTLLEYLKKLPKGTTFEASNLVMELKIPPQIVKNCLESFLKEGIISSLNQQSMSPSAKD